MCQRVEMRVFQLSEDKQKLKFRCPRCGREKEVLISDIEPVASEAQEEATSS